MSYDNEHTRTQARIEDVLYKTDKQLQRMRRLAMKGTDWEFQADSRWRAVLALKEAVEALCEAR